MYRGKATARPVKVGYCPVLLKLTVVRKEFPSTSLIFLPVGWQTSRGGSTSYQGFFAILSLFLSPSLPYSRLSERLIALFFSLFSWTLFLGNILLFLVVYLCAELLQPQPPLLQEVQAASESLQLSWWIIKGHMCLACKTGQNCKARDKTHVWPFFLFASVMSKPIQYVCAVLSPDAE